MHLCFAWNLAIFSIGFRANLEQNHKHFGLFHYREQECVSEVVGTMKSGAGNQVVASF